MSKDARITTLAIMKSMIESGKYLVPDDEFESTVRGFVSIVERLAGPADQDSGGYRAQPAPAARGGGSAPSEGSYQLLEIDDKGQYVRAQVQTPEGKRWASAWDKDAGCLRACRPGEYVQLTLNPSKCGKFLNIKNVVKTAPASPSTPTEGIPF